MEEWRELAASLATWPDGDLSRLARYANLDLSGGDPESIVAMLRSYVASNPEATPSALLATTGSHAAFGGDMDLARRLGTAALDLAENDADRQLAHVCLAQAHFQNRREEAELEAFVGHCRAAMDLGHAGTFCYERLATLYEYRRDVEEARNVCLRAVDVLDAAGDRRSAERFQKRLDRLAEKRSG